MTTNRTSAERKEQVAANIAQLTAPYEQAYNKLSDEDRQRVFSPQFLTQILVERTTKRGRIKWRATMPPMPMSDTDLTVKDHLALFDVWYSIECGRGSIYKALGTNTFSPINSHLWETTVHFLKYFVLPTEDQLATKKSLNQIVGFAR